MIPGEFYASCKRLREDHEALPESKFCNEEFHVFDDLEAHMKTVHPTAYRKQKRKEPKMAGVRRVPWGRPAVRYENQAITPGTEFTYRGHACQVIGAVSASRTRFLAWMPEDDKPKSKTAHRVVGGFDPDTGLIMWEITAPTTDVLRAIAAQHVDMTPGTDFEHQGVPCQIAGPVRGGLVSFLAWFPDDEPPTRQDVRRVPEKTPRYPGRSPWSMRAETHRVADAIVRSKEA